MGSCNYYPCFATSGVGVLKIPCYGISFPLLIDLFLTILRASQVALVVKNLPANARDIRDAGSIPGSGRSPGRGHGNPLLYFCLENPMDRAAWQAVVHRITVGHD